MTDDPHRVLAELLAEHQLLVGAVGMCVLLLALAILTVNGGRRP